MSHLTELELQRKQRMEENARRMMELGVVDAAREIRSSQQLSQAPKAPRAPKRKLELVTITVERRRSERSKKDVNYNERDIFKAEEALARAHARSKLVVARRGKRAGDGASQVTRSKRSGWHDSMGSAGYEAQERCVEAAAEYAEGLSNPTFCKLLTQSMVSGGFWCNCPPGLYEHMKIPDRCKLSVYLADHHEVPEGAEYPQDDPAGRKYWEMVWLPRKEGCGFSGGWRGFALDLNLFPHDVVVIEAVPQEQHAVPDCRFSLTTHIFRALDYETDAARDARLQAHPEPGQGADGAGISQGAVIAAEQSVEGDGGGQEGPEEGGSEGGAQQRAQPAVDAAVAELSDAAEGGEEGGREEEGEQQQQQNLPAGLQQQVPELHDKAAEGASSASEAAQLASGKGAAEQAAGAAAAQQNADERGNKRQRRISAAGEGSGKRHETVPGSKAAVKAAQPDAPTAAGGKRVTDKGKGQTMAGKKHPKKQEGTGKHAQVEAADAKKLAKKQKQQEQAEEEESYEVECILAVQGKGKGLKCHIKWVGYEETTWEPASMLDQPLHTYALAPGVVV